MKKLIIYGILITAFTGCATGKVDNENAGKSGEEIYVFDDVTDVDTAGVQTALNISEETTDSNAITDTAGYYSESETLSDTLSVAGAETHKYFVQLGAFSSLEKANNFVNSVQQEFEFPLEIKFKENVNLFAVMTKAFATREEAELLKEKLRKTKTFADAFIVTE